MKKQEKADNKGAPNSGVDEADFDAYEVCFKQ